MVLDAAGHVLKKKLDWAEFGILGVLEYRNVSVHASEKEDRML